MTTALLLIASGRSFFVSPTGNDLANGRSPRHAWRSLERASREDYLPGDWINLRSGAVFAGTLTLSKGGTRSRPVIIRSVGKPATIESPKASAITLRCGGIVVENLLLRGRAHGKIGGHHGVFLLGRPGKQANAVLIDKLDISGFGSDGIAMATPKGGLGGFDRVRIRHVHVHGNFGAGITTEDGISYAGKGYSHHDLRISDCDLSGNYDGTGMVLSGVDGATVEFCRATNNVGKAGALGMWAWCARNVTFRYCIAGGTRGKSDSGGFDLDGGSVACTVEHCLSFDNDGPGYMHCDYPFAPRTHDNVMRDSVSVNDGRRPGGNAVGFGFVVWGSGLYHCSIKRNLAVCTEDGPRGNSNGLLFATFIRDDKEPLPAQRLEAGLFQDNVVEIAGTSAVFMADNFAQNEQIRFVGNSFRSKLNPPFVEGQHAFKSVEEWHKATGKETGKPTTLTGASALGDYRNLRPRDLPRFFRRLGR
ncbi:MAG TPA: right-handed parallel beta-helix repeat-containing protein [Fimbriimonas sp.]|nr:right-handed parallel beta-helix repeat-containing protein [Fimbriimonas sp.]